MICNSEVKETYSAIVMLVTSDFKNQELYYQCIYEADGTLTETSN
jgi:hypothetical protein